MMERTILGRTGLSVSRSGFGCLPIQRVSRQEAVRILRAAYDGGINFFDTARYYCDSESKMGEAFRGLPRERLVIATKSPAADGRTLLEELDASLRDLKTEYIDVFQFHVAKKCHRPGEADGLYDAAQKAKDAGKIRHIGLTAHRPDVATASAESGLYDTIQFPLSYLSSARDLQLAETCARGNIGFIAMKALSGGLITDSATAFAFLRQYPHVVPIWGIQKMEELEAFLQHERTPPQLDETMRERIERDKRELSGNFCRGCGYCLPCPAGIELNWAARMPQAIRRMESGGFLTAEWRAKMELVKACIHCNACKSRCPYELDTPALIEAAYSDYRAFAAAWDEAHAGESPM